MHADVTQLPMIKQAAFHALPECCCDSSHHKLSLEATQLNVQVERLPVFWKQRQMLLFDAFSFAFPAFLQRIPYSFFVSMVWTVVTYFPVGLAGQPDRCCSISSFRMRFLDCVWPLGLHFFPLAPLGLPFCPLGFLGPFGFLHPLI